LNPLLNRAIIPQAVNRRLNSRLVKSDDTGGAFDCIRDCARTANNNAVGLSTLRIVSQDFVSDCIGNKKRTIGCDSQTCRSPSFRLYVLGSFIIDTAAPERDREEHAVVGFVGLSCPEVSLLSWIKNRVYRPR